MTTRAEQWAPPCGEDIALHTAGRWWDTVRVPEPFGDRTLQLLGEASGAVIENYGTLYWLVPTGSAADWRIRRVSVLCTNERESGHLGVPPAHWAEGPGPHWRVPFREGRYLTDAVCLHEALRAAVREYLEQGGGDADLRPV